MIQAPSTQPSPHPLAELLKEKIGKIAIIDDAFDEPLEEDFRAGEIADFWAAIEADDEARAELDALGLQVNSADDIDTGVIQRLWHERDNLKLLKKPVTDILFPSVFAKHAELDPFIGNLKNELAIDVITLGRNDDFEKELADESIRIVFIDYYMGPENDPTSIINAVAIAKRIYGQHTEKMPLIILMSSRPEVRADKEDFRRESELLAGMFDFTSKDDLKDPNRVFMNLGNWASILPIGMDLRAFVETLQVSMRQAGDRFIEGIKTLSLADYRFIQKLSLQDDGQPLGDYLLELYSAYLGHLLFENHKALKRQKELVDALSHKYPPPGHALPSLQLVKIYQSALFTFPDPSAEDIPRDVSSGTQQSDQPREDVMEAGAPAALEPQVQSDDLTVIELPSDRAESEPLVVEDVTAEREVNESSRTGASDSSSSQAAEDGSREPEDTSQSPDTGENASVSAAVAGDNLELRLGDMFIHSEDSHVQMIISADCDLAGVGRNCDLEKTVLLIPGSLQPLSMSVRESDRVRTELFEYNGKPYRISWDVKKVITYTLGKVRKCLRDSGFEWKARLRLPYALQVQRAFAMDLTRIGMPIAPPVFQPVKVEFLCQGEAEDTPERLMEAKDDLAVVIMVEGKPRCFMTQDFGHELKDALIKLITKLEVKKKGLDSNQPEQAKLIKAVEKKLQSLKQFQQEFDEWWITKAESIELPKGGPARSEATKQLLGVTRNGEMEKAFEGNRLLVVNVIDG